MYKINLFYIDVFHTGVTKNHSQHGMDMELQK